MYQEHRVFVQPDNEEIKVWRYMDFTKLVSLLDTSRLYFARADKLGDHFEGSMPKRNVAARTVIPDNIPKKYHKSLLAGMSGISNYNRTMLLYHAINCWHLNEQESAAMWNLYLKSNEGISIRTSYSMLKASITDDEIVHMGLVNYIDYDKDVIDPKNSFEPFVHKRKSFAHEQEVRGVISKDPDYKNGEQFGDETIKHGIGVKVDLEKLIQRIYVAPSAPKWFAELVEAVVKRYGYKFDVVQSSLDDDPVY